MNLITWNYSSGGGNVPYSNFCAIIYYNHAPSYVIGTFSFSHFQNEEIFVQNNLQSYFNKNQICIFSQ